MERTFLEGGGEIIMLTWEDRVKTLEEKVAELSERLEHLEKQTGERGGELNG